MGRDTNFYYSFLVLPPDKRRAIIAVWDFCRAVDDAVDEVGESSTEAARGEVARWRRELAAAFGEGTPETRQARALAPLVRQFNLPREAFEALIEGVEIDLGSRRYETFADLYEYLHSCRVGGRPHLSRNLRLRGSAFPPVRDRSRGRASAHEHSPGRAG